MTASLGWLQRRIMIFLVAIGVALFASIVQAPTAHAAYIHVTGKACPGSYITYFIWSGDWASGSDNNGTASHAGNIWDFHDSTYDGDEYYHIAVRCDNNVFYYPVVHVYGYASPYNVGWI